MRYMVLLYIYARLNLFRHIIRIISFFLSLLSSFFPLHYFTLTNERSRELMRNFKKRSVMGFGVDMSLSLVD